MHQASLEQRFPDSPQAFEARGEGGANLLGYLLEIRASQQEINLANLSPEERADLQQLGEVDTAGVGIGNRPMEGVRRRMVYLARRDNMIFQPPELAVQSITERQRLAVQEDAQDAMEQAEFDSVWALENGVPRTVRTDSSLVDEFGNTTPLDPNNPTGAVVPEEPELTEEEIKAAAEAEAERLAKKKKKEAYESDFLR